MSRTPRLLIEDKPTVYHIISRTCLPGFPLRAAEKDYLLSLLQRFAAIYFTEILGFCIMGNHFHLLLRMHPSCTVDDEQVLQRYQMLFGSEAQPSHRRLQAFRQKWTSLPELMRDIKQTFSRHYNKRHNRQGYFWGDRYKSIIVEDGRTLVNCLAYIDLNPIRAGIAMTPERYRWCSLGYHLQASNADGLLSLDFGLVDWDIDDPAERLRLYREFVYRTGALDVGKGAIAERELARAKATNFEYSRTDRFALRSRWFTCGALIGSKTFVRDLGLKLGLTTSDRRAPVRVKGLDEFFSFRRLKEVL